MRVTPPSSAAIALRIAAREVAAMLRSPVAYVVAIAFLVVQGLSFTAVVTELSDPKRPAPLGAVLEGHFGGGLLHWTLQIAVVSLLAMRTIAESRRAGTWEVLLTAPVREGAAVVGAWLGALAFYAILWVPTLAYLAVISAYAPAGAHFDPGPIAAAYAGEILVGASFLAIGVAASAATSNQIVAGVTSFAVLLVYVIAGELGDTSAISRAISVRQHLAGFARGEIELAPIAIHAGITVTALSLAAALARAGRRRHGDVPARLIATGLLGTISALVVVLAVRYPRALDVTASRVHTLDAETRAVLARVDAPIEIAILRPTLQTFDPLYDVVEQTASRMARVQPLITVRRIDPVLESDAIASLAQEAGADARLVEPGGAVLVRRGARRDVVLIDDLAEYAAGSTAAPTVTRLRAEEGLAAAIAELGDERPATICVTSGHGELPIARRDDGLDVSLSAERLRRDGIHVEDVGDVASGAPATCEVIAVLGATEPLPPAEVTAIAAHVARGGALFAAASSRGDAAGRLPATGVESILRSVGLSVPPAIVIDQAGRLEIALAFRVTDSYGDHPSVRGFAGWRPTVWQRARPVIAARVAGATQVPLVSTSRRSFATRDVAGAGEVDAPTDPDLLGPLALAIWARGPGGAGPIVVAGSAESLSSAAPRAGVGAGDVLLASMLADLAGRARPDLSLPDRTPSQIRLAMTRGERRGVFALCVLVLPLGFAAGGTALELWRRRRRT